jgi:hypothetical protein
MRSALSIAGLVLAVVRAAYLAATSPERALSQAVLERAARLEWEEMGKLL